MDGDGDQDNFDRLAINGALGTSIDDAGYIANADLDRDGEIENADKVLAGQGFPPVNKTALAAGTLSDPNVGNQIGFDGYHFDVESQLYRVRHRSYDPATGRWLERDPLGTQITSAGAVRVGQQYHDGMNLYGYARHSPATRIDPMGLSSCMDECVAGCPRSHILPGITTLPAEIPEKYVRTIDHGEFFGEIDECPSLSCYQRCRTMCSCPDGTCTPKGQVAWGTPNTAAGSSGLGLLVSVVGEDPSCCSEFGIVQFVRSITGGGEEYGPWRIDDGRVGGSSDPSPVQPYYQKPATIRNPGGRGLLVFGDQPSSFYNMLWDFRIVVMCTAGPASGHIYGMYTWSVGTGVGGVWHGPSSAPIVPSAIPNELPPILQDRECCDKQGASP